MADFANDPNPIEGLKLHELRIVSYLTSEGDEAVRWDWVDGDSPSISQAVGLLEITKILMIEGTDTDVD